MIGRGRGRFATAACISRANRHRGALRNMDSSTALNAVGNEAIQIEAESSGGFGAPSLGAVVDDNLRSTEPLVHDLAIITVSTNEAHWIRACLKTVFTHIGDVSADVVVVDNESRDGTADLVAAEFPEARVVWSRNHGFSHGNNRALMTCNARYILFLNPDTEILDGSFADLVRMMDARPTVGLIGVRQILTDGQLDASIRRFPNALRALGDALLAEHLPRRPGWLGERELNPASYEREFDCDWTTGSFMLVRREAIESAGYLDERYFLYCDEIDFCRRIKTAGWEVRHVPQMTILHHLGKAGVKPSLESLGANSRKLYARKFFSPAHRAAYFGAIMLKLLLRSIYGGRGETGRLKRVANRAAILTLIGRASVPYADITSKVSVQPADPKLRRRPAPGSLSLKR
jgi:N-acetylglucosaminyl-diphospho-decaprenol L-rhamnosyltransferase